MRALKEVKFTPGEVNKDFLFEKQQDERSQQIIDRVILKLKGIFPAWRNSFSSDEVERALKQEWLIGLLEAGIRSKDDFDRGFAMARKSQTPFFPSCGQFVAWCKKPLINGSHLFFLLAADNDEVREIELKNDSLRDVGAKLNKMEELKKTVFNR